MSIKEFWRQFEQQPAAEAAPFAPPRVNGNAHAYAAAALRGEASDVATHPPGGRNVRLNLAWFRLGQHIGAGNIDIETVRAQLWEAGQACGLPDAEIATCLRDGPTSAATAGAQHPRHPAPRDDAAPELAVLQPGDNPDAGPPLNTPIDWHELFNSDDDGEEWIIEPLLPARRMVALYSAPKAGKSLLMLEIAVGIARGTEVLGTTPDRPRRVLYVDFENDPRGDIRTRLEAMHIGPDDLENLRYYSFPQLAKLDTAQGALDLLRHIEHEHAEVVVIDTVSRAVMGDENENDTWLDLYRHTGIALKRAEVACIRLDHSGKDRDKGMRGGSAKSGDVDAVWRLTAVSEDTIILECTDHRMSLDITNLTLIREDFPLRHRVSRNPGMDAADARLREVIERLDAHGIPSDISGRKAEKLLRDAGEGAASRTVGKAQKLRANRPPQLFTGASDALGTHPDAPAGSASDAPPPIGGAGRTSGDASDAGEKHPQKETP